jgi:HEAT repeat protein
MKRERRALVVLAILAGVAATSQALSQQAENTLTPIDSVPTQAQLDSAFGGQALVSLQAIAYDATTDTGIRLRAIHGLALYYCVAGPPCTLPDPAHDALAAIVDSPARSGTELLILRAAVESLGHMQVASDVSRLVPLLSHSSRDIRAATARALRDLCNKTAIPDLRTRYQEETLDQVRVAISDALGALATCTAPP